MPVLLSTICRSRMLHAISLDSISPARLLMILMLSLPDRRVVIRREDRI